MEYLPESRKHTYGKSDRFPGERLFVDHVNRMHEQRPEFRMRLLGTSGVHGEYFPLFQTECEFEVRDGRAVEACAQALKQSDELIRRRVEPHWEWNAMWVQATRVLFFVNWHDFAYFMKHKEIFLGKDHSRFALDFGLDTESISFVHWKIFRDGSLAEFDESKISDREREIVAQLDQIEFLREFKPPRF
jgi:hypothetical protein